MVERADAQFSLCINSWEFTNGNYWRFENSHIVATMEMIVTWRIFTELHEWKSLLQKSFMLQEFPQGSTNGCDCHCKNFHAVETMEMIATWRIFIKQHQWKSLLWKSFTLWKFSWGSINGNHYHGNNLHFENFLKAAPMEIITAVQ